MSGIIAKNASRSSGIIGPVAGSGGGTTNNSVDTMTGDGSDTTLALSVSPGSENNVQITFDGVTQHHSTFSLSGSTITFSTAPAIGVLVEAVSGTSSTTGTPDDGTVSLAKMAANSIDSDQYVDGSIDEVHLSANSIDSDSYVDGSIDLAHIATNQIDETLMKDAFVGDFTDVTVTAADTFLYGDTTDSGNTKKDTVQGILDLTTGTAYAWVQFDGTGTPAVDAGLNVSSITDHGAGSYTINFTSAFADALYCAVYGNRSIAGNFHWIVEDGNDVVRTTSAVRIGIAKFDNSALADSVSVSAAFFR